MRQSVTLVLEDDLRRSAMKGEHNFISHLVAVLEKGGYQTGFAAPGERVPPDSRIMTHMTAPPPGGLTFRRVYHYPFWAIEQTSERWKWHVAKTPYPAETETKEEAPRLYARWRRRLFSNSANNVTRDGYVYVPLQGRLLQHRGFQRCAPLDMLRLTLAAETSRPVIACLHPKETYSTAERTALEDLASENPRLSIRTGGMDEMLRGCDYVVTMNSAAAFNGYFFGKPCILFARIDFHHIALNAGPEDLSAFDTITDHRPGYARYLAWFWQENCINAGRPEVRDRIRAALIRGGWPMMD
jgi:hypothetical protein